MISKEHLEWFCATRSLWRKVFLGVSWASAPEYEGLGYSRLTTEVTKGRLRLIQNMAVSRFATENDLGRAMTHLAQRWTGSSTPVSTMHVDDPRLLLPLDGSAPQSTHKFYELQRPS